MGVNMKREVADEIIQKIVSSIDVDSNNCWNWNRVIMYDGYGRFVVNHLSEDAQEFFLNKHDIAYACGAHKAAFLAFGGRLTKTKPFVLHRCNNKTCCNYSHLYAGSYKDNMQDSIAAGDRLDVTKYRNNPPEVQEEIRQRIINGESFFIISKVHDIYISNVVRYADMLEREGHEIVQRNNYKRRPK